MGIASRSLALLGVVLATFVVVGCSGSGSGGSDEDQIQALVDEYANALIDNDYKKACSLFTPQELKEQKKTLFGSCESLVELADQFLSDDRVSEAKNVEKITINGDTARITYPNEVLPKEAQKVNGKWLFSSAE